MAENLRIKDLSNLLQLTDLNNGCFVVVDTPQGTRKTDLKDFLDPNSFEFKSSIKSGKAYVFFQLKDASITNQKIAENTIENSKLKNVSLLVPKATDLKISKKLDSTGSYLVISLSDDRITQLNELQQFMTQTFPAAMQSKLSDAESDGKTYARKNKNWIDIGTAIELKADKTYVDNMLGDVDTAIELKADKTYVDNMLGDVETLLRAL